MSSLFAAVYGYINAINPFPDTKNSVSFDWSVENWWKWLKRLYKVEEPLWRSENALPLQIVAAFVTDLLLRVFKQGGGFKGSLYEFVTTCRDLALVPLSRLGSLRDVLLTVAKLLGLQVESLKRKL